ncbi:MAG: DUF167 domain-containing protein [Streptosporangiales bacterium]|nr:DUF167 domain-containing protein [Streptosporangiales bacterium]
MRFPVRVQAGARRTAVGGQRDSRYGPAVIVAVTARAVEGKANEAVRRAIAAEFGVRPAAVRLVAGERSKDKLVEVDPAPPASSKRLDELRTEAV